MYGIHAQLYESNGESKMAGIRIHGLQGRGALFQFGYGRWGDLVDGTHSSTPQRPTVFYEVAGRAARYSEDAPTQIAQFGGHRDNVQFADRLITHKCRMSSSSMKSMGRCLRRA